MSHQLSEIETAFAAYLHHWNRARRLMATVTRPGHREDVVASMALLDERAGDMALVRIVRGRPAGERDRAIRDAALFRLGMEWADGIPDTDRSPLAEICRSLDPGLRMEKIAAALERSGGGQ